MDENLNNAQEELTRVLNAMGGSAKITVDQLKILNAALGQTAALEKAAAQAEAQRQQIAKNFENSIKTAGGSALSFGNALLSAEKGLGKYGGALKGVGDAALIVGQNLGTFGKATMYGVKAVTVMADQVLKQADRITKGFDAVAQVGASAGLTASQMKAMANEAGLSTFQMEALGKAAAQASEGFVSAGGSVGSGMLNFGKVITNNIQQFRQLGFSVEEVMEMNATYLKQQANFGISLNRPLSTLQKTSEAYVKDLVALADLTGQSVKSQQAAMDFAAAQDNFSQELFNLSLEEQRLRKAGMKDEADAIAMRIKNMEAFAGGIAGYSNEVKTGLLQAVASGGRMTGELQAKLLASGLDPAKYARMLKEGADGAKVVAELQKDNAESMAKYSDTMGKNTAMLGEAGTEQNKAYLVDAERRKMAAIAMNQDTQKQLENSRKGLDAQLKGRDTVMKGVADMEQFERNMQMKLDNVVEAFNPFLSGMKSAVLAFGGLMAAATLASAALMKIASRAGGLGGAEDIADGRRPGAYGRYARRYGGGMLGRAGLGIGGGLVAAGADMAGEAIGGAGGAAVSTLGSAGGMAMTGLALGGPLGAAIGGIAGLGMGLLQNRKALFDNTAQTKDSDDLTKRLMEKYDANTEATKANTASTAAASKPGAPGVTTGEGGAKYDAGEMARLQETREKLQDARNRAKTYDERTANEDAIRAIDAKIKIQKDLQIAEEKAQKEKDAKAAADERAKRAEAALQAAQGKPPGAAPAVPAATPTAGGGARAPAAGGGAAGGGAAPAARPAAPVARPTEPTQAAGGDATPAAGATGGAASKRPSGSDQPLLDFIAKHESGGNYNILVGGKTKSNPSLTEMTVGDVLKFQGGMKQAGHESSAVGRYQIIKKTLAGLVGQGVVKETDKFDQSTQDKAAIGLLNWRKRQSYKSGQIDADTYADNLSMEWASLPFHTGKSYYSGVGSNKAGISRADFVSAIQAKTGGLVEGPDTGFPAVLHGKEMITPLKPDSILEKLANTSTAASQGEASITVSKMETVMKNYAELNQKSMSEWVKKLDKVIDVLENSHNTQEKLLRVSR